MLQNCPNNLYRMWDGTQLIHSQPYSIQTLFNKNCVCVNMFDEICIKLVYILFFATKLTLSMSLSIMSSICIVKPVKICNMWKQACRYLNLQFSSVICQLASNFSTCYQISLPFLILYNT